MQALDGTARATDLADDPRSLVLRGLTKEYRKGSPVLCGIDLVLPGSGLTAIIGPSGTGKSTLIRCINRLVQPTSGEILFRDQDLAKLSGRSLRNARRRIPRMSKNWVNYTHPSTACPVKISMCDMHS